MRCVRSKEKLLGSKHGKTPEGFSPFFLCIKNLLRHMFIRFNMIKKYLVNQEQNQAVNFHQITETGFVKFPQVVLVDKFPQLF